MFDFFIDMKKNIEDQIKIITRKLFEMDVPDVQIYDIDNQTDTSFF